jgi:hypothetical protein
MTALHPAALWYAEQGVPVFPCRPGEKVPATKSGVKDATTDRAQVDTWWSRMPTANIGLATGFIFDVLDIDDWAGVNSDVEEVIEEGFGFVATPRGGTHIYLRASGDGNATNVVPGVDFRGRGGYVLAPPSVLPNGVYRWLEPVRFAIAAAA